MRAILFTSLSLSPLAARLQRACGIAAYVLVAHAESQHVDTHVGRGLVWTVAVYAFKECIEHWEDLDVTVVACSNLSVGLEMERVDHVHIIEVCCSCFVCDVYRMFQWEVPDWESLELCISCLDVSLLLVVELAETYRHLSASWSWGCDHYERACCLHEVVLSESLVRVDEGNVVRIAFDCIVIIYLDAETLETVAVCIGAGLTVVVGHHDAAYIESYVLELTAKTQNVLVISDSKVTADLVLLNVL